MSAIAVIRTENGIVIACDSLAYDPRGIVQSVTANKVVAIPEWNCVIGNVGFGNFSTNLRAHMGLKYRGFDDLLLGIAEDFKFAAGLMVMSGQACPVQPRCTLFVAGWSTERERFESYRISITDKEVKDSETTTTLPAFTLIPLPESWCSTPFREEDAGRFGLTSPQDDPVKIAVGFICACRAASSPNGADDFEGIPAAVGGQIQVLQLDRDITTIFIAHRWPDEIGKPLDPFAGEPMPQWLVPNE